MFQILKGPKELTFEVMVGAELLRMRATWRQPDGTAGKAVMASAARSPGDTHDWVRSTAHKLACHVQTTSGVAVELGW